MTYQNPNIHCYNQLALTGDVVHDSANAEITAGGFSSPAHVGGRPPSSGFFSSVKSMASLWASRAGDLRVCRCLRSGLLTRTVPPTRLAAGAEIIDRNVGANTMARTTQRTRAKSRFTLSAYNFTRRFFGPVVSFRIASMGGK